MRWLASLTIGSAAFFGGMGFGRILGPDPSDPNLVPENPYTVLVVVAVYGTAFMVILGLIAVSLRRLAISARARQWQTERALGGTMRRIVASEARLGLRHGILVSGSLVLLGAASRQLLPWFDGHTYLRGGHFELAGLAGILLVVVMCATTTVVVYLVAALTALGASVGADAIPTPARATRSRRLRGRTARLITTCVFVAATAALVWRRLVPMPFDPPSSGAWSRPDYWWSGWAIFVFVVGCVVLVTGAVTATAGVLSRATGRALISRGRGVLLQAGDALARPSTERRLALGTMAIVLGLVTWISGASDINVARTRLTNEVAPLALVRPTAIADQDSQASPPAPGYATETLDPGLVASLSGDDRLLTVPFAYLRTDNQRADDAESTTCDGGSCTEQHWHVDSYAVINPADLARLSPDGLRPLGFTSGVTMQAGHSPFTSAWGAPGPKWLTVDGARYPTYRSPFMAGADVIDASWAQERFGAPPINGLWLQLSHPEGLSPGEQTDKIGAILDEHIGARTDVRRLSFDYGYDGMFTTGGLSVGGVATAIMGLLLGVALVGALAARSARDRRRDLATMAALGASPRVLRMTPVVEMVVTTVSAAVAGVSAGLILAVATTQPLLFAPGAPLSFGDTMWLTRWNAAHISWAPIATAALGAVLLTAIIAAVSAASMARRTPVDELREAIKEGAP